jgi:hypothetical protein
MHLSVLSLIPLPHSTPRVKLPHSAPSLLCAQTEIELQRERDARADSHPHSPPSTFTPSFLPSTCTPSFCSLIPLPHCYARRRRLSCSGSATRARRCSRRWTRGRAPQPGGRPAAAPLSCCTGAHTHTHTRARTHARTRGRAPRPGARPAAAPLFYRTGAQRRAALRTHSRTRARAHARTQAAYCVCSLRVFTHCVCALCTRRAFLHIATGTISLAEALERSAHRITALERRSALLRSMPLAPTVRATHTHTHTHTG